ncbi:MAG TPA: hypothetical protein VE085_08210 [Burkholderiales bacterium]|nr:hypothetical protein [Burkholderiales bacterium]
MPDPVYYILSLANFFVVVSSKRSGAEHPRANEGCKKQRLNLHRFLPFEERDLMGLQNNSVPG